MNCPQPAWVPHGSQWVSPWKNAAMEDETEYIDQLLAKAAEGHEESFAEIFEHYHARLSQMVRLRLDRRLAGRVDEQDVLQEAYLAARQKLARYLEQVEFSPFLWLRLVVGEKLIDLHRHHLGTQARDAQREISIYRGPMPTVSSVALAAQLMGRLTSPSNAALRTESKLQIQEALNRMSDLDREVLTLRHFESLTNSETAQVLGLSPAAASNRYVRALARMKSILAEIRGD